MINVTHITSGDLFGGAENVLVHLLKNMKQKCTISVALFNYGKLYDALLELNINVKVFDEKVLSILDLYKGINFFLNENDTDILHTHGFKANFIGNLSRLFVSSKKIYSLRTEHGFNEYFKGIHRAKSYFYYILNLSLSIFLTDKIICVSNHIAKSKFPFFLLKKISVIHNGVDFSLLDKKNKNMKLEKELNPSGKKYKIGSIGRLVTVKDFDNFIEAAKLINNNQKDCLFYIIGEGPLKKDLSQKVSNYGLTDYVKFTGFRDDIINIIEFLDVVVISSKMEGIPMTLLESLYKEKEVVATAVGGIPEVIVNQEYGILVKPNDSPSLATGINSVLSKLEKKLLTSKRKQYVLENFSSQKMTQKTIYEYKQLLKRN